MPHSPNSSFKIPDLFITQNGAWLADGEEITHERTLQLLRKSIFRDSNTQDYFIRIGREQLPVRVEDTAYFVVSIQGTTESGFQVRTSEDIWIKLNPLTLRYQEIPHGHPRLTCEIQTQNDGRTERARFLSAPYHALLMQAQESAETPGNYLLTLEGTSILLSPRS